MASPATFVGLTFFALSTLVCSGNTLADNDGKAVYLSVCSACHAPENVMVSSPKAWDITEWSKRLSKGIEATTDNALNGFGAMPPKGGATELSRDQVRQAIQYMATPHERRDRIK